MIKNRRSQLSLAAGSKFSVGQEVQFTGRGTTIKGILEKINQKTAVVVDRENANKWKVSITMLEAA